MKSLLITSSLLAMLCAGTAPAMAQEAQEATGTGADTEADSGDVIIVTGRAGTGERTKAETSYSITNISEERLRLQAPTSVTEALKSVPGFWVEASGGEASGNVRARGVPVDGFGSAISTATRYFVSTRRSTASRSSAAARPRSSTRTPPRARSTSSRAQSATRPKGWSR